MIIHRAASRGWRPRSYLGLGKLLALCLILSGCQSGPAPVDRPDGSFVVGENRHYTVVQVGDGESYRDLANRFLGDAQLAWVIADANGRGDFDTGDQVVIPRQDENPVGVYQEGYQVVPILSYHRVDRSGEKLAVTPEQFERQLDYLRRNGFRVIPLETLRRFFREGSAIPARAMVITIDDGYSSAYHEAYPILRRFGFPATLFVYTDFLNQGGLTWQQLLEMNKDGLISVQPHSKTHANLDLQQSDESLEQYERRLLEEVLVPKQQLEKNLSSSAVNFAYPFGKTNKLVVRALQSNDYALGLTVRRGSNPYFSFPYTLRRSMVFGPEALAKFAAKLQVFSPSGGFRGMPRPSSISIEDRTARAKKYVAEDDLARGLREWRIVHAISHSREARKHVNGLEKRIKARVGELVSQAQASLDQNQLDVAQKLLTKALAYDAKATKARRLIKRAVKTQALAKIAGAPTVISEPTKEVLTPTSDANSSQSQGAEAKTSPAKASLGSSKHANEDDTGAVTPKTEAENLAQRYYHEGVRLFERDPLRAIVKFERALRYNPDHKKAAVYLEVSRKLIATTTTDKP